MTESRRVGVYAVDAGGLVAIWLKRFKDGPMDAVSGAEAMAGWGLKGNVNQGGRRQVTLIEERLWAEVVEELGADPEALPASTRRANLMVRGVSLAHSRKRVLRVGPIRMRIFGETRPCRRMEESWPGLEAALRPAWRGGAFGEVLDDGHLCVGDPVAWLE